MPQQSGHHESEDALRDAAADWLIRLRDLPADDPAWREFRHWLDGGDARLAAYLAVERAWDLSLRLPAASQSSVTATRFPQPAMPRSRRFPVRAAALALGAMAACLILLFLPGLRVQLLADRITGIGETQRIALEDGSIAHLDADSAIAIRYSASRREILLLEGQAFFEVKPQPERPFVVTAETIRTIVTGTSFAVRSGTDKVSVALRSGRVEMKTGDGAHIASLRPGDRLTVDSNGGLLSRSMVVPDDIAAWREKRLLVEGMPLGEVVEELGRYHQGVILMPGQKLAARKVTGSFDLARPVEALEAAVGTQNAHIIRLTPYLLIVRED